MPTVDEVATMVENLKETFSKKENFKYDDEFDLYYAWDTDLDYDIDSILIMGGGCCWPAIEYASKMGPFWIHAGEKDSFGWLTGVIEPRFEIPWAEKKPVRIIYG
jgi:hypothetical protein